MNLLVISDLHMSNNDSLSAFGWSEDDFIKKLDMVRTLYGIDKLILNGDIFELCKYDFATISRANRKILDFLAANEAIFIRGNHDFHGKGSRDYFQTVNSRGQSIIIKHGHESDFFGGTRLGRLLNDLFFRFLRRMAGFSRLIALYFGCLHQDEELVRPGKYQSYAAFRHAQRLLEKHDVVILGHTHKVEAHQSFRQANAKLYLNSGTCCFGRLQGVMLDTESLRYDLIQIDASRQVDMPSKSKRIPVHADRTLPEKVAA